MKRIENSFWKLTASGFGLGYSPVAPGTMGAIGAMGVAILILNYLADPYLWLACLSLVFTILGVVGSNKLQSQWGKDPSRIVIDEMVGMWVSLMWVGSAWIHFVGAFILFRFFDIVKPLGIRKTEKFPGGWGVMADDILAGFYTNIILQIIIWFILPVFYKIN
ncbi:MAG: phosphatidylglycerophosphatase A [Bacteroidales bacterium]|nr:phosphatidylglycerophosphatase A [Bacteroidales bacterium]